MSRVAKFSGSYLSLIAIALLMGFALETGSCQSLNNTNTSEHNITLPLLPTFDLPEDISYYNYLDTQGIKSFGNGPLGLISQLNSSLVQADDGSWNKSRMSSVFSYGSDLMEINESSWLVGYDEQDNEINRNGYNQLITLKDASFPFAVIQDDLVRLSGTNLTPYDSSSKTYLLLYDDYSQNYNLSALQTAFGNSSQIKMFKYDPEMSNLTNGLGIDLSMYFSSDMWSQFGQMFNNKEIMAMFNKMARDQLARKDQPQDDNVYTPRRHWFEESEGGVQCIWGTVP